MTNEEFIESIRLPNEEWRPVVGFESFYMVSSLGRIIALTRRMYRKNRYGNVSLFVNKPHLCKSFSSKKHRYERIVLNNKNKIGKSVHRLVAEAFIPNPNNYPQIDHINDNPIDNRKCNLCWCTAKQNSTKESHRIALSKSHIGKPNPNKKPIVSIDDNGCVIHYKSITDAEKYNHIRSAIRKVLYGSQKKHHGYIWMHLTDYESLVKQDVKELLPNG